MSSKTGVHGVLKSLGQSGPKTTTKTGKLVMRIFLDQKENSFSAGTANINLQKGTRIGVYKATNKKESLQLDHCVQQMSPFLALCSVTKGVREVLQ